MGLFTVIPALYLVWEQTPYPRLGLAARQLWTQNRRPGMAWSKAVKAARRAEAAGQHPRPRGRAPRGADGRRKRWDMDNGGWCDDVVIMLPLLAAPLPPSPAPRPPQPQQTQQLSPSLPSLPPVQQQRSETFSETVLVTPAGSRGHKLKRTSPGGTTRCAQYTSPAGTAPQLMQCESRAIALADVGWSEFGMNEPRKSARGFSWSNKWRYSWSLPGQRSSCLHSK